MTPPTMTPTTILGDALSPGSAEGALAFVPMLDDSAPCRATYVAEPTTEIERFQQQVADLRRDLEAAMDELERDSLSREARILRAHLLMLEDPEFHRQVHETIRSTQLAAQAAVEHVLTEMGTLLQAAGDSVLAERVCDLTDLRVQLQAKLKGDQREWLAGQLSGDETPVLAVSELLPSLVLEARRYEVRGFVVEHGTKMAHAAILARSFAIPVVRVATLESLRAYRDCHVRLDADHGELIVEPDQRQGTPPEPATGPNTHHTVQGDMRARLWLSIVDPTQLEAINWTGLAGVGLYRTETLFMQKQSFPSEQEQMNVYARVFELAGGRPVTVRSLDLGGDKRPAYLGLGRQANPYLGLRAHRLYRYHPELLVCQLRAILRAAKGHHLRLLHPMIEHVEAWQEVQELVAQAVDSLRAEGASFQDRFEQGVLVETPSAVWDFPRLLKQVDFTSVGTNDLVQYLFAVERDNANVATFYQPEHPVVLQVLQQLAEQAEAAGRELSICGEIAGDLRFVPLLIGLGLENLTVSPAALPQVQAHLPSLRTAACRELARTCLAASDAAKVGMLLGRRPGEGAPQEDAGVADPVCGMAVPREGNPYVAERDGERYHFCSQRCLDFFRGGNLGASPLSGGDKMCRR